MKTKILKLLSATALALLVFSPTTYAADSGSLVSHVLSSLTKCLDVPGFNFMPNQGTQIFTCNGGINQQWTFRQIPRQFQSRGSPDDPNRSLCLSGDAEPVHLQQCFVLTGTEWMITQNQFVNAELAKCIDRNGATSGQLRVATCSSNNTSANQKFVVEAGLRIRATNTKACWDVPNGLPGENVPINLFSCHNGTNQKWVIYEGGTIRYHPDQSFCVAINAQSKLALSQECGTTAVQWVVRGPLVSHFNLECLNASSSADGTAARTTFCNGGVNQRWDYWP
jgi:Ricin-type beta-trefoil lectin domain.